MTDRHQFRADWHDYEAGIYFITICTQNKHHYFGQIAETHMRLSPIGKIAKACIEAIPQHNPGVEVWNYVIMPNHIHLVISVGTRHGASTSTSTSTSTSASTSTATSASTSTATSTATSTSTPTSKSNNIGCLKPKRHEAPEVQDFHHNSSVAVIIGQFKSTVKRHANQRGIIFNWQPRYHDHIIQSQYAYENIMHYIDTNVENWCRDCFNKTRIVNLPAHNSFLPHHPSPPTTPHLP